MKSRFTAITKEEFDRFLFWINPDASQAAEQYVLLQRKLTMFFAGRGCAEVAIELASETLDRAAVKFSERHTIDGGEPGRYLFRIATYILMEHRRRPRPILLVLDNLPAKASSDASSVKLTCCKQCVDQLPEQERVLLRDYYLGTKAGEAKRIRAEVAGDVGVRQGALRVRVFRTKQKLIRCVGACTRGLTEQRPPDKDVTEALDG